MNLALRATGLGGLWPLIGGSAIRAGHGRSHHTEEVSSL
jgi:hypothetical protein